MKRVQISVGCFAMPLACGTLILIMVVYFEFAVANLLLESPCETNKAYSQNLIRTANTSMSRIECGLLCETNDACNSFTYNRRSGLCQLSTGKEKNCDLLTDEADSQYFTVVSIATLSESLSYDMLTRPFPDRMDDYEKRLLFINCSCMIS